MAKKRQILVIGHNTKGCTSKHEKIAYDVGAAIAKSGSVLGYKIKGVRFDCGNVNGYINAVNYIYNESK